MNIFKYKFLAHKFVNYIFYFIVFAIGFFIGYAGKNFDFKRLIPNILLIDNVSAYTLYDVNDIVVDEDFIIDHIPQYFYDNGFTLEDYPYVISSIFYHTNVSSYVLRVQFVKDISNLNVKLYEDHFIFQYSDIDAFYYDLKIPSLEYDTYTIPYANYFVQTTTFYSSYNNNLGTYTNFDFLNFIYFNNYYNDETNPLIGKYNKLDFSGFNLEFNSNLFANNNDFKEVCVDNHSSFAITRTSNPQNLDYMTDYDYIWFPYNIHPDDTLLVNYFNTDSSELSAIINSNNNSSEIFTPGLSSFTGTLDSSSHVYSFDSIAFNFYNTKEKIDSVFDSEEEGLSLQYKGYTNKYSYYGWSSLLFNLWFDYRDGNDFNFFPIITLDINHSTIQLGSSGTPHGGGSGRRLGIDDEDVSNEVNSSSTYCFYIKNEYVVTKVNIDEFNDFYGTVPTQNGNFEFYTSANKISMNSRDIFSIVSSFMTKISSTVHFINSSIYDLYSSLPLIVRMFILSCLTLFLVKLVIDMIVR